jgi:hypothetical protein
MLVLAAARVSNLHVHVHVSESVYSLGEETKYDASAEFAAVLIVVHVEDLCEVIHVHIATEVEVDVEVVSLFRERTLACKTAS